MASFATSEYARGVFLLKRLEQCLTELQALPDSRRKAKKLAELGGLKNKMAIAICNSPRGFTYLALSEVENDGKLEFPDITEAENFSKVRSLLDRFGHPGLFNSILTDEDATVLVELAINDPEAWAYTKMLCSRQLQLGRELHPILLKFTGLALMVPQKKGRPGRPGLKNVVRNQYLAFLGRTLQSRYELPFVGGVTSQSDSACSVISEVMVAFGVHMTEEAIRKAIEKGEADKIANGKYSEEIVSSD